MYVIPASRPVPRPPQRLEHITQVTLYSTPYPARAPTTNTPWSRDLQNVPSKDRDVTMRFKGWAAAIEKTRVKKHEHTDGTGGTGGADGTGAGGTGAGGTGAGGTGAGGTGGAECRGVVPPPQS